MPRIEKMRFGVLAEKGRTKVGDRVAAAYITCGICEACKRGLKALETAVIIGGGTMGLLNALAARSQAAASGKFRVSVLL